MKKISNMKKKYVISVAIVLIISITNLLFNSHKIELPQNGTFIEIVGKDTKFVKIVIEGTYKTQTGYASKQMKEIKNSNSINTLISYINNYKLVKSHGDESYDNSNLVILRIYTEKETFGRKEIDILILNKKVIELNLMQGRNGDDGPKDISYYNEDSDLYNYINNNILNSNNN